MTNKITSFGLYSIVTTVIGAVFAIGFAIPAFNQSTYDANYPHVVKVFEEFEKNKNQYIKLAKSTNENNFKFNNIVTVKSKSGFPTILSNLNNKNDNVISGCQDIWLSLSNSYADYGNFSDIKSGTEFFVDYDYNNQSCLYIYVDKDNVKTNTGQTTHIISYNLKTGKANLLKNSFQFSI